MSAVCASSLEAGQSLARRRWCSRHRTTTTTSSSALAARQWPAVASRAAGTRRLCASAAAALDEALPAAALDAPPLPPQQQHQQQPAAGGGDDALGDAIEAAFLRIFSGPADCPRVLASWRRLRAGDEFARDWPGLGRQQCASYMEGLPEPPPPFPDLSSPGYEWLLEVERSAEIIIEEFERVTANAAALERQGNCVWVPAARADALAYGPDWRTLVLQDRGEWDKFNAKLFPRTRKVIEAANAPTLEVFFARQAAGTGIASHTDDVNFIQTSHLGLIVPEGDACWMKCGDGPGSVRTWARGRAVTMDTSFMHETLNGTDSDRYVLIMRHWHPATTPLERVAAQFLFDAVDRRGTRFAEAKATKQLRALGLTASSSSAAPSSNGSGNGNGASKAGGAAAATAAKSGGGGGKAKAGGGKKKKK